MATKRVRNGSISIQKNIPVPAYGSGKKPMKYPWPNMKVGDSFDSGLTKGTPYQIGDSWALRHGKPWRFRNAKVNGTIRVWRIK